jgi:ABC-type dipeptide/oligopeptide/nickel transport system permease component
MAKFGMDKPLAEQYADYLKGVRVRATSGRR